MPFEVIDIELEPRARDVYDHALTLARADDRIAWRGNEMPADPGFIIDRIRGAA